LTRVAGIGYSDSVDTRQHIEQLRERIGWSLYRLAKESGVPYTIVHNFLGGKRDIYTKHADAMLCALKKNLRRR